jgi:hypothetical protein
MVVEALGPLTESPYPCRADGPSPSWIAELLIDCEEDRTLRVVLVGMLREDESREQPWPFEAVLHYEGECPGAPRAPRGAGLNLACGM